MFKSKDFDKNNLAKDKIKWKVMEGDIDILKPVLIARFINNNMYSLCTRDQNYD